jgi:hypothetical protein
MLREQRTAIERERFKEKSPQPGGRPETVTADAGAIILTGHETTALCMGFIRTISEGSNNYLCEISTCSIDGGKG